MGLKADGVDEGKEPTIMDTSDQYLLLLIFLIMDTRTLESQVPMGRQLLLSLAPLQLLGDSSGERRQILLREVTSALLDRTIWEELLTTHGKHVMQTFSTCKRGKQKDLTDQLLVWMESQGAEFPVLSANMLQLVYASDARNHVIVGRWLWIVLFCLCFMDFVAVLESCMPKCKKNNCACLRRAY